MKSWNRLILDILLIISVIILPWWLSFIFSIYLLFLFNNYIEFIIWGGGIDILYGVRSGSGLVDGQFFFIASLILYIILSKFKKHIRSYA